jgi:hypothetical protein
MGWTAKELGFDFWQGQNTGIYSEESEREQFLYVK